MNVLVTGGAGFIGSNLAEELSKKHEVVIIDDLSTGRVANVEYLDVELVRGSTTDPDMLKENFRGVDYVFHQAALPSVQRSVEDPVRANEVNVCGTLNVLIAARVQANVLARMLLGNAWNCMHDEPRAGDVRDSLGDISRAAGFGYVLRYGMEDGLSETIEWFGVRG